MEISSKLVEQIAFITRPKIGEHMLIVMDKSTHEEHLSQALQTNKKHYKIAVTFLTGYNGIFNITNSNTKFYFKKLVTDEDFIKTLNPHFANEIKLSNNEIKRINIDKGHCTEATYPFTVKPNFSTMGSIVEISQQ